MKKVLIITYYWPPSGGAGVQRWAKFAKYLPQFGWKPVIVTPKNPEYPIIDKSLINDISPEVEVIRLPIWEPYGIFKKITGRKKEEKVNTGLLFDEKRQTLMEKVSLWIRGNILIPDPRVFWVNPSAKRLKRMIPTIKPDIMVTTGPPHSIHLIGLKIKKKSPSIKWVVDFRDPWSEIDYLDCFYASKIARNRQKRLEKKVINTADRVITVSPTWAGELQVHTTKKVNCITNGFDSEDFASIKPYEGNDKFVISYFGIINSFRNRPAFWQALEDLCEKNREFYDKLQIQIIGTSDSGLAKSLEKYPKVVANTVINGYIPHTEVIKKYNESSCLLLLLNKTKNSKGHIPGKLFEYLAAKRPILFLGDVNGDAAKIIENTKSGKICSFSDKDKIRESIEQLFYSSTFPENSKSAPLPALKYSRKNLTRELIQVFEELV